MMWIRCATLLLALSLASTASAQQTRDSVGSGRSALDVEITSGARTTHDVLGEGERRYTLHRPFALVRFRLVQHVTRLAPNLALEFELDAALHADRSYAPSGAYAGFWAGSPWLGLGIAHRTPSQTLRVSVGLAPPLTTTRRTDLESLAAPGLGRWNEWLTSPNIVPLGVQLMGEWRFTHFDVGADAALILAPSFSHAGSRGEQPNYAFWAATGVWLTGHLNEQIDLGARLQWVAIAAHYDSPRADGVSSPSLRGVMLMPYVRYVFPRNHAALEPSYFELRTNINLVERDGPFLIANEFVWSLGVAAGTNW